MKITYAHILIVDNDRMRRNALAEQLQQLGYAVSTASAEEQPLGLLSTRAFELALLDVDIASENQCALLREVRNEEALAQLPLVILAETADLLRVGQCLENGATDYLLTPAKPNLLKARITNCLEHKYLREQVNSCWESFNEMERLADDLRLTILPLGIALSAEKDFDRLLEKIVIEAKKICNADAGTLYLRTEGDRLQFTIVRTDSLGIALGGATGKEVPYAPLPMFKNGEPNHANIATHVALEGFSENIRNIYEDSGFDFSGTKAFDQRNNYRSISCLTIPLKNVTNGVIGVLQLLNAKDEETHEVIPFSVYHQLVVESLASQAAVVLHNKTLSERQRSLQAFERDLQIGRQIQADFFPSELPQPPGWELAARFQAARQVAGDFYDAFAMANDKVGIVVADVCDKGLPAALFMALVRSLVRAFTQQQYYLYEEQMGETAVSLPHEPFAPGHTNDLLNAIHLTNAYLSGTHRQTHMFATLFFGVLDPDTGQLAYANCGHTPPIIFNSQGVKSRLNPTGPAIGLTETAEFTVADVVLQPGDALLAFTDGVTEARDPQARPFTIDRLLALLPRTVPPAETLLERIDQQVQKHMSGMELFDDITMLALRRQPEGDEDA